MSYIILYQEATFQFFNYNINNSTLSRVQVIKDLGVLFDHKLSFEAHINTIVKKAYKMLGFIFRSLNKFKRIETYKLLYFTYVRSQLEYCTPIWNPHYNVYIEMIERVQRRFTRSVFRKFRYIPEKHYSMRNMRLGILSLEDRRILTDEITLYKIQTSNLGTTLYESLSHNIPLRTTRHNNNIFYLPFVTTNVEYYSPMHRIQRQHDSIFNNLELNEPSLTTFKRYATYEIKNNQIIFDYSFD